MGTTLTNGVYLPNEGERNCYAGLKTNWEILDQKVADVTALQQAVAGALHREIVESLPTTDINPNTIYMVLSGTSATENVYNEFMYVNNAWELIGTSATDLTNYYTKAEVDGKLLLKANDADVVHKTGNETIAGVKTFTDTMQLKSNVAEYGVTGGNIQFYLMDKNSVGLSKINQGVYSSGVSYITLQLYGRDSNNQTVTNTITYQYGSNFDKTYLLPTDTKVDLGSTTQRWGKIYGTQYYYGSNNVEFSNKFVTTDTDQTISGSKTFSDTIVLQGTTTPTVKTISNIIQDSTSGNETISRVVRDKTDEHDVFSESVNKFSRRNVDYRLNIIAINNGTEYLAGVRLIADPTNNTKSFGSSGNNTITLGDSGNRWRDVQTYKVNGVEPSSLSLPSGNASDFIDISSYLSVLDGSNANTYVAPANGWISITMSSCSGIQAYITGLWGHQIARPTVGGVRFFMPVLKNNTINILIFGGTIDYARFIPCQGNV